MFRLSALMIFSCVLASPQAPKPATAPSQQEVFRAATQEVLLDIVVRDKKGKLILDLKPEEVEVYDEGVREALTSFRLVTGSDAVGLGSGASGENQKRLDPMRHLRLVSLVYEGLDNEARRLARRACNEFLKDGLEQNVYVAIFVIGERLHVLQPFTNDLMSLRKAVDRATTSHYPQFVADSEAIRKQLATVEGEGTSASQAATSNLPGRGRSDTGGISGASAAARFAQLTLNMLNFEESLTRSQQSRSSLFSILSLVKEQTALPGRKTLVYFTRGLQVPENMVEEFNNTISAANRAGVSIYGVDARGLTLDAQNSASASMLQSAVGASKRQQTVDGASVTPEQVKIFDTALDSIRANTQEALGSLSDSTGGFLVANSNDLREPLKQIHEDLLTYYEVSYVPQITEYDGRFHRLTVKVNRPDVRVQSRSGYFALPPDQGSVFSYEVPLFNALTLSPPPTTIPFHTAAMRFGQQNGKVKYLLAIEVPLKELKTSGVGESNHHRTRLSVLALLKDQRGAILERFSRDFPFEIPADRLAEFQKRNFLQTYAVDVPPGRYALEVAVMDREGNRISARRVSVIAPAHRQTIAISCISLIRRLDPQSPEAGAVDPFHYEGKRVVPTLENSVQSSTGGGISFHFVVYPEHAAPTEPQLVFELSRDGIPIGSTIPEFPSVKDRSAIPYVASFPLAKFSPGQYELRVIIRQGSASAEERTVFTINP